MGTRLQLHSKLESILNSENVYFQPPESIRISYPAIIYGLYNIYTKSADDLKYKKDNMYYLQYISDDPDNTIINNILDLPYCRFEKRFVADNLYHDNFKVFF